MSAATSSPVPVSSPGLHGASILKSHKKENSLKALEIKYGGTGHSEKPTDVEEVGLSLMVGKRSESLIHLTHRFGFRDAIAVRFVSF